MPAGNFRHLELRFRADGIPKYKGFPSADETTRANRTSFQQHGQAMVAAAREALNDLETRANARNASLPAMPPDFAAVAKIDPKASANVLRNLGFEIVGEQQEGVVLVASPDSTIAKLVSAAEKFSRKEVGGGSVAQLHHISASADDKLRAVVSDQLRKQMEQLAESTLVVVEIGISVGVVKLPKKHTSQRANESGAVFARRVARYELKREIATTTWDERKTNREDAILRIIHQYQSNADDIVDRLVDEASLPDSFTVRARLPLSAVADIAINFPHVFEIAESDEIEGTTSYPASGSTRPGAEVQEPHDAAPLVCIIDSGLQEAHPFLIPAVRQDLSRNYVPGENTVADEVPGGGHGTRIAGAVLLGAHEPSGLGAVEPPCFLANARILDARNGLSGRIFVPRLFRQIADDFGDAKIFNLSVNTLGPCRTTYMSAWAAEIDNISFENDVLFVISAGNIEESNPTPLRLGISQHLSAGRSFPNYLLESSCRVASPGQSLASLTVGSLGLAELPGPDLLALGGAGLPSCFSRSGFALWNCVKPEVVEIGGDLAHDTGNPPTFSKPSDLCPELIRTTWNGGPLFSKDAVGTSFATPKVTHTVARVLQSYPEFNPLVAKALVVHSARWPEALASFNTVDRLRLAGFGVPDAQRATVNSAARATLVTPRTHIIGARQAHFFSVSIPPSIRGPALDSTIRVDVTLTYAARPRRTRQRINEYFGVWLDWKTNDLGEGFEQFEQRISNGETTTANLSPIPITWVLGERRNTGLTDDVRRVGSTLHDWVEIPAHRLGAEFCVAVRGHEGWSTDADEFAKYALVVSFESLDKSIPVYAQIEAQIAVETEAEIRR